MKNVFLALILAATAFTANAQQNLVVNGDFETGNFTGWTKSGNTSLSDVIANSVTSNSTYVWRSGATGSLNYISQNLATTVGGLYTLSFDVFNSATSNQTFEAWFDGALVYSFSNEVQNWTNHGFANLVATGLSTELKFGVRNDPSFTRLDNIGVTAVPEPGTYAMLLAGLGILGLSLKRRAS
ncbi:hypothetical protein GCM10027046_18980 [Uliginosibacterium flavum]|uniref:PEP-CTERM sorting domain-containing protein n=1 Tax=Uliginosibacterium flavum TaxID=1396831 RepID=A0ABV2TFN2_9RHOO